MNHYGNEPPSPRPTPEATPTDLQPSPLPSAGESLPDDLRAPWGWMELGVLVLVAGGSAILLSYLLALAFLVSGVSLAQIQRSGPEKSLFLILNQVFLFLGLLGYLAAQVRVRFGSPFWHTIGWRKLENGSLSRPATYLRLVLGGFLLAFLVQLSSAFFPTKAKMPIEAFFQDRRSALGLMLIAILLAPVVEETIFRGYVYPVLARSLGIPGGVALTGSLFGLLHAPQLWGGWPQIALLILVGIVLTWVRARTRTVFASFLLHLSYNSFLFGAYFIFSSGLNHQPIIH